MRTRAAIAIGWTGLMLLGLLGAGAWTGGAGGTASRAVAELDNGAGIPGCVNNDDFGCAELFFNAQSTQEETVQGQTGLYASNPVDVYVIRNVRSGMVINASLRLSWTGDTGAFKERVVWLEAYRLLPPQGVALAWSRSGHRWEALSVLAIQGGDWYLRLSPMKGGDDANPTRYHLTARAEYPKLIDLTQVANAAESGTISNQSYAPGKWFRVKAAAGPSGRDLVSATASFNPTSGQFDLYARDLQPEGWAWWHNFSWAGEGLGAPQEAVEFAADYSSLPCDTSGGAGSRCYYVDLQAWNGSGAFQINFARRGPVANDGDNEPESATQIVRTPGLSTWTAQDHVNSAYDKYDWYRFDLRENETMSATLTMRNFTPAVYRISLMTKNDTTGGYNTVASLSTYRHPTLFGSAKVTVTDADPKTYYLWVNAQIALDPQNFSNTADWHVNTADGDYTLAVDLPNRNTPPVCPDSPIEVFVPEDAPTVVARLADVCTDRDAAEPELLDEVQFSIQGYPEHVVPAVQGAGHDLLVTPEADWNGQTKVTVRATDRYGATDDVEFQVVVRAAQDVPTTLPGAPGLLPDFWVREGEVNRTVDGVQVSQLFRDADLVYGDQLTYTGEAATADASAGISIVAGAVRFAPARVTTSATGDLYTIPARVTATDGADPPGTAAHTFTITVVAGQGEIGLLGGPAMEVDEGGQATVALSAYFRHSRGKAMEFSVDPATVPRDVRVTVRDGTATILALGDYMTPDQIGGILLRWTARRSTPEGEQAASAEIPLVVRNVPDAPVIVDAIPRDDAGIPTVREVDANGLAFAVTVSDIDTPAPRLRYRWSVEGEVVWERGDSFTYLPGYESAGSREVTAEVSDQDGGTASHTWQVDVTNQNRPPRLISSFPVDGNVVGPGRQAKVDVTFVVEVVDDDSEPLQVQWIVGSEVVLQEQLPGNGVQSARFGLKVKCERTVQVRARVTDAAADQPLVRDIQVTGSSCPPKVQGIPGFEAGVLLLALAAGVGLAGRRRWSEGRFP